MSIFVSWLATLAFFSVVYGVGRYLQLREKQSKVNKRVTEAIYRDLGRAAAAGGGPGTAQSREASTFGTRYGALTEYERQRR